MAPNEQKNEHYLFYSVIDMCPVVSSCVQLCPVLSSCVQLCPVLSSCVKVCQVFFAIVSEAISNTYAAYAGNKRVIYLQYGFLI